MNIIKADLYKILKSKSFKILIIISTLSAIIMYALAIGIETGALPDSIKGTASAFGDPMITGLLGAFLAGMYLCGDFETKNIDSAITDGYARDVIVYAKTVTFAIMMIILTIPYAVFGIVGIVSRIEVAEPFVPSVFLNMVYEAPAAGDIPKVLALFLTMMLAYAAQLSIGVLYAFLVKKNAAVICMVFATSMLMAFVMSLASKSEILKSFFDWTPFNVSSTNLNLSTSPGKIIYYMGMSLVFINIIAVVTKLLFRKKDI